MPERTISAVDLRTGAHIAGWLLTAWAVISAIVASLSDRTVVGIALNDMGLPRWVLPLTLVLIATLQLFGHVARSRQILLTGDLTGGLVCWIAASLVGNAAVHGENTVATTVNWAFIGCQFLLHTVMLGQRRQ